MVEGLLFSLSILFQHMSIFHDRCCRNMKYNKIVIHFDDGTHNQCNTHTHTLQFMEVMVTVAGQYLLQNNCHETLEQHK